MKCPFLITRKDVLDNEGRKVEQEIELKECIKNECMVYDGATKLCSLLSSNMKTGVLINDIKNGIKAMKEETFQRTEALGAVVSTTIQTLQEALLGRFEVLRKQNEVMVLGFDRVMETINGKFDEIKSNFTELNTGSASLLGAINEDANTLKETINTQGDNMKSIAESIQTAVNEMKNANIQYAGEVKAFNEELFNKIASLKNDQATSMSNVQGVLTNLEHLFEQSSDNLTAMQDMMRDLNNNYIESLGKIAGLAEGMRKGVDKVGEGMHDSVSTLVTEMKNEIGALEKQYEKTFGDIANLAEKFDTLSTRIGNMTKEVETEFKSSFDRQEKLSDYTKTILEHIKEYFVREEARYKEEQRLREKKEGLDHFDRATLYYYRGNYELAVSEINKALEIEQTAEYLNLRGLLLAELGKFDLSKKTYKEALKIEPNLAEIHNNLGLLFLRMKKVNDAVVSFQEAVKKNVNYALAYVNLGKALIELEKFDEAIKVYERALEIDPANHDAREAIRLYKEGKIGA